VNRWLRSLLRGLAAAGAGLVILLALLVGLFRLLVPQVPEYQSELEAWATRALGVPVSVGRMDARLTLAGPELSLYGATVGGQGSTMLPLVAREVSVILSLPRLVIDRQLAVARVRLNGVQLELARDAAGDWLLQGQPLALGAERDPVQWPEIPDFELIFDNGELVFQPGPGQPELRFADIELQVTRDGPRVSLDGGLGLPEGLGSRMVVSAEARPGEGAPSPDTLRATPWRVFVELGEADAAGWRRLLASLDLLPARDLLPAGGRGEFRAWLSADGGAPLEASAEFDLSDLAPPEGRLPPALAAPWERLSGRLEWRRHARGWTVAAGRLQITREGYTWPASDLRLDVTLGEEGGRRIEFTGDFLRLQDLQPALAWVPDTQWRERLAEMAPAGVLSDLELSVALPPEGEPDYQASGRMRDLRVVGVDEWPGVEGLTGGFRADASGGRFELASDGFAFERRPSFADRVSLGRVQGLLVWRRGPAGWRVVGDDIRVSGVDLTARGDFELLLSADEGAEIDVQADVMRAELGPALMRLLPVGHMPPRTVRWLRRGFPEGELLNGRLELSGRPRAFPFENGDGHFLAEAEVRALTLDYADDWPVVTDIAGRVRFERATLTGEVTSGTIAQSPLLRGEMAIDNLRRPTLTVEGEVDSSVDRLLAFLRESRIREVLGEPLFAVRGSGAARTRVELVLPLFDIRSNRWRGQVDLAGARVGYGEFPEEVIGLRGRVLLDTGRVSSEDLVGTLFGEVFTAELAPAPDPGYHTELRARGRMGAAAIVEELGVPLEGRINGATEWSLQGLFPGRGQPEGGRPPLRFALSSPLQGLELDLPVPAGKPAGERLALALELAIDDSRAIEAGGALGDQARWLLRLRRNGDGWEFTDGHLRLGGDPPRLASDPGLVIDGELEMLQVDDWLAFAGQLARDTGPPVLRSVDLRARRAFGLGQEVTDLRLALTRGEAQWDLELDSEAVAGEVVVPFDLAGEMPVTMRMRRLRVAGSGLLADPGLAVATTPARPAPDPRRLPPLDVSAEDFVLAGMALGRLDLELERSPGGLTATRLQTDAGSFSIGGGGSWIQSNGATGARTRLALQLRGSDVADMLQRMQFEPFMTAAAAEIDAELDWAGAPFSADWRSSLNGGITVSIRDGRLSEVEPGAGRVVGLMSLSALPRRLALDFRDVFGRGFGFDRIDGDFLLIDGNAYTDNLRLRGATADIALVGRTGLVTRDYEQQAVVTADVGMALPAVGGLLAGPGVAAAILLFQEVFRQPMRGIGQAAYCLSGPWEAPSVARITPAMVEEGELCLGLPEDWAALRE
jgi:uncharacterized protein (TIGR02099 family)